MIVLNILIIFDDLLKPPNLFLTYCIIGSNIPTVIAPPGVFLGSLELGVQLDKLGVQIQITLNQTLCFYAANA